VKATPHQEPPTHSASPACSPCAVANSRASKIARAAKLVNATYDLWATQITRRNLALGRYRLAAVRKRIWPGEVSEARRVSAAKRGSSAS
jgi:hypothetical protein